MDDDTMLKLEQVREQTPRYLFRAWRTTRVRETLFDLGPSGGNEDLNTTSAITPLAFYRGTANTDPYTMSKDQFLDMADKHLSARNIIETQFSSWAASLGHVIYMFARSFTHDFDDTGLDKCWIGIVDTKMCGPNVKFWFAPGIEKACEFEWSDGYFDWEYLAHGVISEPAYKAVPLKHFWDAGVISKHGFRPGDISDMPTAPIDANALRAARSVGERYGEALALPMTLAILCTVKRGANLFRDGVSTELRTLISKEIQGLLDPREHLWRDDSNIITDVVYTEDYGDVEQLIRLMRALMT